jgi:predicted transcriptional regulator
MPTVDDLTSRFLDAFTTIEKHLRRALDANKYTTFNELVEKAARQERSVRRLRDQLRDLGELRNFLVHEYKSDQPVAFPSESTVRRIQMIRDELLSPVKLVDLFRHHVEICSPTDPIGVATKKMHDGSFSQLPVYSGNTLEGLLTSETVARWLAAQLADGQGILEERPVEEVMRNEEGTHLHVVMGRNATVDDALCAFDDQMHAGKVLDAIILTHSGNKRERPVGIVTAADQPRLRSAIRV